MKKTKNIPYTVISWSTWSYAAPDEKDAIRRDTKMIKYPAEKTNF
jgi:accessory colonization factor AcfC